MDNEKDETSFIPTPLAVDLARMANGLPATGLSNLAFTDTEPKPPKEPKFGNSYDEPLPQLKEGEAYTVKGYPSEFTPHKERKLRRPNNPRKKPPLLSPEEQQDLIRQRKRNLYTRNRTTTHGLRLQIAAEDYNRLIDMAEKEAMGGALGHAFTYFVAWCLKVGLRYYEDVGLTHINPDKITFIDETPEEDRIHPLRPADEMRTALERSTTPNMSIHPILGRTVKQHQTALSSEYGNLMSPDPRTEDLQIEARYLRAHRERASTEHVPDILEGRPAFDTTEMRRAVSAMLPATLEQE